MAMFSKILERFMQRSPVPVMVQALLERVLSPQQLNTWFEGTAVEQYTRSLLFSTVFELMSEVVFKTFPSIHAAYQESAAEIGVSVASVYNKLNGLEPSTAAALVRDTAREKAAIIATMGAVRESWLPGYRIKVVDGNCIEATEHRLEVLRETQAGALPGKCVVVYDPALEMAIDVFPCEDGHAQERSLLGEVLASVEASDVWLMDRNFCVRDFLCGIASREAYFISRQHQGLSWKALTPQRYVGQVETGKVYEQLVQVVDAEGNAHTYRRIRLSLNKPTRDGETQIFILTNLPKSVASAQLIAEIYRRRWRIESMFQELERHLHSEINTLGYPKAALFGFCVALVAYNVLAVVKAALRSVHGDETIDNELSGYYLAGNIARTYDGMVIAVAPQDWAVFHAMPLAQFADVLLQLAANVKLAKFRKHPRGPKKAQPKRDKYPGQPHVSTARLLAGKKPRR
jgi:hypothetical protein